MILIDLNVLLDVIQRRKPGYRGSAAALEQVVGGDTAGCLPAHAFTTLHYIVGGYQDRATADRTVDWMLRYFEVVPAGREVMLRARTLGWDDFEDAVVAAAAESAGCDAIVTRNVKDFRDSPVPAWTPEEFLLPHG